MAELTPKQRVFCYEYVKDKNGTRAAIAAGFSKKTASEIAYEYLRKPHIRQRIRKIIAEQEGELKFGATDVVKELVRIACLDAETLQTVAQGKVEIADLTIDERRAISEYKVSRTITAKGDETEVTTVKAHSKTKALDLLAKHFNLFKDHEQEQGRAFALAYALPDKDADDQGE